VGRSFVFERFERDLGVPDALQGLGRESLELSFFMDHWTTTVVHHLLLVITYLLVVFSWLQLVWFWRYRLVVQILRLCVIAYPELDTNLYTSFCRPWGVYDHMGLASARVQCTLKRYVEANSFSRDFRCDSRSGGKTVATESLLTHA
jgi:hypothetical protein